MSPTEATMEWVEQFVLKHGLCPFAVRPFREGRVVVLDQPDDELGTCFAWALTQVQSIVHKQPGEVETSLLVFSAALTDFEQFLDFITTLEEVMHEAGADELVQLAHFHPDYQFAGVAPDDPGNRTNRSPYPIIQLLRTQSVSTAIAHYPDVEEIPNRNIVKMRSLFPPPSPS